MRRLYLTLILSILGEIYCSPTHDIVILYMKDIRSMRSVHIIQEMSIYKLGILFHFFQRTEIFFG